MVSKLPSAVIQGFQAHQQHDILQTTSAAGEERFRSLFTGCVTKQRCLTAATPLKEGTRPPNAGCGGAQERAAAAISSRSFSVGRDGLFQPPPLRRSGFCGDALLVAPLFRHQRVVARSVLRVLVVPAKTG